jgi:hypothetical protein
VLHQNVGPLVDQRLGRVGLFARIDQGRSDPVISELEHANKKNVAGSASGDMPDLWLSVPME